MSAGEAIHRGLKRTIKMSSAKINGKEQELELPVSVIELIRNNNVKQPETVSVQLNGSFVLRENYEETLVHESDEIDFLYFMGGGSQC
jgi:sulfur carrier protein